MHSNIYLQFNDSKLLYKLSICSNHNFENNAGFSNPPYLKVPQKMEIRHMQL